MAQKWAFKDCIDFKLYPAGTNVSEGAPSPDPEGTIVIDYLNESELSLESQSDFARIKGANAVAFTQRETNTLTVSAEVIPMEYLAFLLGGEYDDESQKISVKGDPASKAFAASGTFRGKQHGTNEMHVFQIVMYNISPQVNGTLTLNATDIGSFQLVFDLLVDENDNLIDITVLN